MSTTFEDQLDELLTKARNEDALIAEMRNMIVGQTHHLHALLSEVESNAKIKDYFLDRVRELYPQLAPPLPEPSYAIRPPEQHFDIFDRTKEIAAQFAYEQRAN